MWPFSWLKHRREQKQQAAERASSVSSPPELGPAYVADDGGTAALSTYAQVAAHATEPGSSAASSSSGFDAGSAASCDGGGC